MTTPDARRDAQSGSMDSVGGYRVIRRLGGGATSEVLLAHDQEQRAVVVRLLDAATDDRNPADTIEALSAVEHENLLPLIDFAVLDDRRVMLVHPRVAGGTLGELLAGARRLTPEEAAGVIRAVAGAVAALHAAGWSHGRISPNAILLSLSGDAVLTGFGSLAVIDADSLVEDLEAVRDLALLLAPAGALHARIAALPSDTQLGAAIDALVARTGQSRPVDLTRPSSSARPHFDLAGTLDAAASDLKEPRASWLGDLFAPAGPVVELADRVLTACKSVRPPFWFGAAGVAVALVASAVLIPQPDDPAEASDRTPATSTTVIPGAAPASTTALPSSDQGAEPAGDGDTAGAALTSDDPLAAVRALLERRQRCIQAASEDCLTAITQDGSPARDDAVAAVRAVAAGEAVPGPVAFNEASPFVQRTGGSAIVTGGQVSILVVKSDGGWRLRDVFDAPS